MVLTRNGEATQQRLLYSALELYAERGYAGTCLDAILERASSSKGAFYHHFESKEQLTAKALDLHWENLLDAVYEQWSQGQTPLEKLDKLLETLEPDCGAMSGCPLGLLGFESRSLPERVQQALEAGLRRWSDKVTVLLLELGLKDNERTRSLAEQLFLMYEGGVLVERISGSCAPITAALNAWRQEVVKTLETQA